MDHEGALRRGRSRARTVSPGVGLGPGRPLHRRGDRAATAELRGCRRREPSSGEGVDGLDRKLGRRCPHFEKEHRQLALRRHSDRRGQVRPRRGIASPTPPRAIAWWPSWSGCGTIALRADRGGERQTLCNSRFISSATFTSPCTPAEEVGGNAVDVLIFMRRTHERPGKAGSGVSNLHSVWDDLLISKLEWSWGSMVARLRARVAEKAARRRRPASTAERRRRG